MIGIISMWVLGIIAGLIVGSVARILLRLTLVKWDGLGEVMREYKYD